MLFLPFDFPRPRAADILRRWTESRPSRALSDVCTRRNAAIAFVTCSALLLGIGIVSGADEIPSCPLTASILSYPRYGRKGLVDRYEYRCGQPDRTCTLREYTAQGPVLVCSPFSVAAK